MRKYKLVDLNKFNVHGFNNHQLSLRSGVAGPTVRKYMNEVDTVAEPSLPHIAQIIEAMGLDLDIMTIGSLLEPTKSSAQEREYIVKWD